jgi:hypothetical protein
VAAGTLPNVIDLRLKVRWMKCATGICDACTVGPGLRLCVEGPVLSAEALKAVPEYGVGHRDAAGILHPW